jgi:hypothetical protein
MNYVFHLPDHPDLFPDTLEQRSPAIGVLVKLDRQIDRVKPCHSNTAVLAPGTGPHAAALICVACGQHRGWATRQTVNFVERLQRMFGRGDALPIVRDHAGINED